MALISVVMPVYNGEKYLKECIQSVLDQSFIDWELIIVDDGSEDLTYEICCLYANNDKRINVIRQQNAGVSVARNNALKNVTGKYVAFIDADDIYTVNHLEAMLHIIERNPDCDCVFSDYYDFMSGDSLIVLEDDIKLEKILQKEYMDRVLLYEKLNSVWRYLLRADIAKRISFNCLKFAEDYFYLLEYAVNVRVAIHTNQKLYYYRKDNVESMTQNTKNSKYLNDYKIIPQLVSRYIKKNNLVGSRYQYKIAREYAYSSIRIRKVVNYKKFVAIMNDTEYRESMNIAKFDKNNKKKSLVFWLVKNKIYFPFRFI